MVSAADLAKRALVVLLKSLEAVYELSLGLRRDSPDDELRKACRKVSKKVHPDRGGDPEQQKALNNARDAWEDALKQGKGRGRRLPPCPCKPASRPQGLKTTQRVQSSCFEARDEILDTKHLNSLSQTSFAN